MTSQQLPERANLEQLKKQAKSLLHAAREKDPDAIRRFQILPAPAGGNSRCMTRSPWSRVSTGSSHGMSCASTWWAVAVVR